MTSGTTFAEAIGSPLECGGLLLWNTFQEIANDAPNSTALIPAYQQGNCLTELVSLSIEPEEPRDCLKWTSAQLMEASINLANRLFELEIRAGDTFVAFIPISVEWAALLWACARLQVAFAPLNPAFLDRSESIGCITLGAVQDVVWHEETPAIGYVTPGNSVRVCKPGSRDLVKKGEIGELHVGGSAVIHGYKAGSQCTQNDAFYSSDGNKWLATGDLALMDCSEAIYVKGGIKDMIIRGGEKISPTAMENCLETIEGVKSQVIGISDSVVGQVPVAVIETKFTNPKRADFVRSAQRNIKDRFGNTHQMRHVFTLEDLKLASFPATATGKVKKAVLRELIEDFTGKAKITTSEPTAKLEIILRIWRELLAADDSDITQNTSVATLAESLVMLRFCFEVEQRLDQQITVAEILENVTPIAQARLIGNCERGQASITSDTGANFMWVQQVQQTKKDNTMITDSVRLKIDAFLQPLGASWSDDVEAVYEPHEGMGIFFSSNARPSSSNGLSKSRQNQFLYRRYPKPLHRRSRGTPL